MSDTYKWGTWYPIETAPRDKRPFDIWVPSRQMSFRVGRWPGFKSPASDSLEYWTAEISGEPATHWMPRPPSPEEMAARPTLEEEERLDRIRQLAKQTADEIEHYKQLCKLQQLLRKRRGYYRGLPLDDPKSMHINATSRVVYEEICNLLKEAGLE